MASVGWFMVLGISAAAILVHGQPGDTMTPTKPIKDGQTLMSSGGTFELGFFSPGDSKSRYLGIQYKGTPDKAVVWVANRISPVNDSTGVLNLTGDGNLVLLNGTGYIFWSTDTSNAINPVVQLLDSGNLVLIQGTSKILSWQSFDHPSNILLPGMKLERDLRTNIDRHLTSWKSSSDPSPGDYSYKIHINAVPELFLWRGSVQILYRTGPWTGRGFNGIPEMETTKTFRFNLSSNEHAATYTFVVLDNSILSGLLLNETGVVQRVVRFKPKLGWDVYWWHPKDPCDEYANCGVNGVCSTSYSPACDCLRGFSPKSPQNWRLRDNSDGCVRRTALNCSTDGFSVLQQVKLPDTSNATVHSGKNQEECEDWCLKNCTCSAYAIIEGSGCVSWTGDLVDIRLFTDGWENLHVRLASSELGDTMTPTKPIKDGQTLMSSGGTFELGFFSPGDSKSRYLGIQYKGTPDKAVVWVANRISPVNDSTGVLNLTGDDKKRSAFLNWQKRLDIILGIARGLLYLHQDSRLKIIHRDLKASNILLDEDLNPKISDFGTARIFKVDQIEENTKRVVGTYGYMSPEYAMDGIFSVKSDVFSFGVLVLEILSGKKNRMIKQAEAHVNLLGHAWRLWTEGRCLEILDEAVGCTYPESKVLQCIQVALSCVQERSEDRPTMAEVVLMLGTEGALLPQPQRPGFYIATPSTERDWSTSNKLTVTIEGR
ncbi:receptor-like serine/threonine-protein kinase SD1-8 [Cocos nucifera]|uniref:Receptor-like serine/threonine-protein kinase n=1 Tax=Cocos nucifera TaxID=13894 RepID=A0A8K0IBL5_COCNU|nr:receptor-like serine/threonine-protein kinase SD1-8 [Cocos nucifera]